MTLGLRAFAGAALVAAVVSVPGQAGARAQDAMTEDEVMMTADEVVYDDQLGIVTASGNVEVTRGSRVLHADTVSYNQRADMVTASGNIALLEPDGTVMFADYIDLAGDLKSGVIESISMLLADRSRFAAAGGRMSADGRTELSKVVYSPCDLCPTDRDAPPLWQVKAVKVVHDKQRKQITYTDAFLEFFGVPVLYVPYFSHADPTVVRRTGFLSPSFGNDSVLGTIWRQPIYFNISPSQEAIVTPIVTTLLGPVLTGEYREMTETGEYRLAGSVTRVEREPGDRPGDRTRGHLDAKGGFDVGDNWRWGFDIERASDPTYLARYGFSRGQQFLTQDVFFEGSRGRDYARIDGLYFQSLDSTVRESTVPFVAPLALYKFRTEPAFGGYFAVDANAMILGRPEGPDSRRLSVRAGWTKPFVSRLGEIYSLNLSVRGDVYHVADVPTPNDSPTASFDGVVGRVVPQIDLSWRLPFVRSSERARQVIEPIAQFVVSPRGGNSDKIPNEDSLEVEFEDTNLFLDQRFPGLDRVEGGPRVNYGLRWAAYAKTGGHAEALIGQSYRLIDDDTFEPGTGLSGHFSDYVGRIKLTPGPYLDLAYRFRIDEDDLRNHRQSLTANGGLSWLRVGVSYTNVEDEPTVGTPKSVEQITGTASLSFARYWNLSGSYVRDLNGAGALAANIGLTYQDECFRGILGISRDLTSDLDIEQTTNVYFKIQLLNLG